MSLVYLFAAIINEELLINIHDILQLCFVSSPQKIYCMYFIESIKKSVLRPKSNIEVAFHLLTL